MCLHVAKPLVAKVFLGLDVLRQHHSVRLELGSDQPETVIYTELNELALPAMKIAPPTTLSKSVPQNRVVTSRKTWPSWSLRLTARSLTA